MEGRERVRLPPGEEQRGHELTPSTFAVRIFTDQAFDVSEQLLMLPERQSSVDEILFDGADHALESKRVADRERLVEELRERGSLMERQRAAERTCGGRRFASGQRAPAFGSESLEARDVDRLG